MRTDDFNFNLPDELIAQFPTPERRASRLLRLDGNSGELRDAWFRELPELLAPDDLLIFNDTRVIKARLTGQKASGGKKGKSGPPAGAPSLQAFANARAAASRMSSVGRVEDDELMLCSVMVAATRVIHSTQTCLEPISAPDELYNRSARSSPHAC